MRVEMREAALAKARGAGVVTSVSRKGGHVSGSSSSVLQRVAACCSVLQWQMLAALA